MGLDIKALNEKTNKGSLTTVLIISALLVITAVTLIIIGVNTKISDRSTTKFERAFTQIQDFNEQTNIYSKQEMAPDIISALDEVIGSYPNTTSGARAVFYKGYIYYSIEDYDQALEYFNYFIKKYNNQALTGKAYYYLSYCYEAKSDTDNAINVLLTYEKKYPKSHYVSMFDMRLGTLYESSDKESALKYYKKIIDSPDNSSQKDLAEKKIIMLENDLSL